MDFEQRVKALEDRLMGGADNEVLGIKHPTARNLMERYLNLGEVLPSPHRTLVEQWHQWDAVKPPTALLSPEESARKLIEHWNRH